MVDRLNVAALVLGVTLVLNSAVAAENADPTRPPPGFSERGATATAAAMPPAAPLLVSSLFLLGDKPYALVDGQIVHPGDPLAEGKVTRIDAHGVWIGSAGKGGVQKNVRLLKWLPEIVKTPPKVEGNPAPKTTLRAVLPSRGQEAPGATPRVSQEMK